MIPKPYNDDEDNNWLIDQMIQDRIDSCCEYPALEDIKDWPKEPPYKEPEGADDLKDVLCYYHH